MLSDEAVMKLMLVSLLSCSWAHTERTQSVFISRMEHGDIHTAGLMCPKRLGMSGTRQGVQFNQAEAHLH